MTTPTLIELALVIWPALREDLAAMFERNLQPGDA